MADDNVLKVQIQLDDGTVTQGFAKIQSEGENTFKRIGDVAAGVLASQVITGAVNAIKSTFEEAIGSAAAYGAEIQKLNGNLALTGQYSEATSKSFTDLADKIQATTAYSDDQVLSIAALGSNFTHSADQTRKLTTATLDFAAATGKDANEAAQQLSLTLQGNIGRLGRYFPQLKEFTASQLEAGAAVDFLAARFAGAAVAQSNTYAASVQQLGHAYDDFLKSIGQFVTQSPTVIATIKFAASEFLRLAEAITGVRGGNDVFQNLAQTLKDFALTVATVVLPAVESLAEVFNTLVRAAAASGLIFTGIFTRQFAVIQKGIDIAKGAVEAGKAVFDTPVSTALQESLERYQEILNHVGETTATFANQDPVGKLHKKTQAALGPLQQAVTTASDSFYQFGLGIHDVIQNTINTSVQGMKDAASAAFKGFANAVTAGFSAIGKALVKGQDVFHAFAGALLSGLGQAAIQMGSFYVLLGLARLFASYGADATGYQLLGIGASLAVLGGALSAFGDGVTGTSNPATSVNTGGGSAVDTSPATSSDSASGISQTQTQGVTVNIQGDVLDSRETGLRIVDLINDSFNTSGAKVVYS